MKIAFRQQHRESRRMKILAIEHELAGATTEKYVQYSTAEALRAWELHQQGIIRELYFRADRSQAILVLECDSAEAAQQVLATLPFVQNGLIAFEFIPLKAYPGFARLFSPLG
jgi:muconolactone delta-isomerase